MEIIDLKEQCAHVKWDIIYGLWASKTKI